MSGAGAGATPPGLAANSRGLANGDSLSSTSNSLRAPLTAPPGWDWRRARAEVCERSSLLANSFPLGDSADIEALAEDIVVNGQRLPILRYEGQLEDGRRRDLACAWAGVTPEYVDLDGMDRAAVSALVLSLNGHRRHSTLADLALSVAHAIEAAVAGGVPVDRLASAVGIRRQAVYKARLILRHRPDLEAGLRAFRITLEAAYQQARAAARARPAAAADLAPPRRRGQPLKPIAPEEVPRRWGQLWRAARRADPLSVAASLQTEAQAEAAISDGEHLHEYLDIALPEIRRRWPGITAKTPGNRRPPTR